MATPYYDDLEKRRRAGGLAGIPASARTAPMTPSNRAVSQSGVGALASPGGSAPRRDLAGIRQNLQAQFGSGLNL